MDIKLVRILMDTSKKHPKLRVILKVHKKHLDMLQYTDVKYNTYTPENFVKAELQ